MKGQSFFVGDPAGGEEQDKVSQGEPRALLICRSLRTPLSLGRRSEDCFLGSKLIRTGDHRTCEPLHSAGDWCTSLLQFLVEFSEESICGLPEPVTSRGS